MIMILYYGDNKAESLRRACRMYMHMCGMDQQASSKTLARVGSSSCPTHVPTCGTNESAVAQFRYVSQGTGLRYLPEVGATVTAPAASSSATSTSSLGRLRSGHCTRCAASLDHGISSVFLVCCCFKHDLSRRAHLHYR